MLLGLRDGRGGASGFEASDPRAGIERLAEMGRVGTGLVAGGVFVLLGWWAMLPQHRILGFVVIGFGVLIALSVIFPRLPHRLGWLLGSLISLVGLGPAARRIAKIEEPPKHDGGDS